MPKKTTVASIKDDDILADILGELEDKPSTSTSNGVEKPQKVIAPARIVSNSSKKSDAAVAKEYMNNFMNNIKMKETANKNKDKENSDDELLDSIMKPKPQEKSKPPTKPAESKNETIVNKENKNVVSNTNSVKEKPAEVEETKDTEKLDIPDDDMDFSCFQDDDDEFEMEKTLGATSDAAKKSPAKPAATTTTAAAAKSPVAAKKSSPVNEEEDIQNLLSNWENICQMDNFDEELTAASNATSSETSGDTTENLRFWYWEAWEDPLRRPGEVFLFGRTADGKSICVRVEKIDRVVYLLPREYVSIIFYLTLFYKNIRPIRVNAR